MSIKIKNVYDKIVSPENLYRSAHRTLLKGLRYKENGADWKLRMEYHINKIHRQLTDFTYRHGKYQVFKVYYPKERTILAASITDRVVHHALHDVIEPIVDRKFINHSYACRLGRGQHAGIKAAKAMLQANDYCIHLDVKKFFYNIHRDTLLSIVRRTIKDEKADWLLTHIVDSSINHAFFRPAVSLSQLSLFDEMPEVNATGLPDAVRGLPIGNLTSQLLANWYLNELDQFVKHELKHSAYIRYMDDMVIFGNHAKDLNRIEKEISAFCNDKLMLALHDTGGASPYYHGLTFLGFRIFRDHTRVKSASVARFRNKLSYHIAHTDYRKKEGFDELFARAQSWNAHAANADTWQLRTKVFGRYPVTEFMMKNNFKTAKINQLLQWN